MAQRADFMPFSWYNHSMENPEFLKNKYKDLEGSEEVKAAAKRERARRKHRSDDLKAEGKFEEAKGIKELTNNPQKLIENYLARIERVLTAPHKALDEEQAQRRREKVLSVLKRDLYDSCVIKPEDVPQSYFDLQGRVAEERGQREELEQGGVRIEEVEDQEGKKKHYIYPQALKDPLVAVIIRDQQTRCDKWFDYLTSKEVQYPWELKYFALRSALSLTEYDKEEKRFPLRSKGTVKPFPDLDREALGYVMTVMQKKYGEDYQKLEKKAGSLQQEIQALERRKNTVPLTPEKRAAIEAKTKRKLPDQKPWSAADEEKLAAVQRGLEELRQQQRDFIGWGEEDPAFQHALQSRHAR